MTVDESMREKMIALMRARHGADYPGGGGTAGAGGGPHDPGMGGRIAKLETGLSDVLITLARIEAVMTNLATRPDAVRIEGAVNTLDAKIVGLDARVGRVETNVGTALTTAVGKAIGPVQFLAIVAGSATALGFAATAYAWAIHQPWFSH